MSRESLVFLLGVLLFFLPFMGIPSDWKKMAYVVIALILIVLGYSLRRQAFLRTIEKRGGERSTESFVENHMPRAALEVNTEA